MSAPNLGTITVDAYLDALASATPVPGGGAVAGLTLAQSNALGAMVVGYAIGKPKFAAHDVAHRAAHAAFEAGRRAAMRHAADDAAAYAVLNALWKLPKDDPARASFQEAVRSAIAAPEATVTLARATLMELERLVGTTSPSLASDLRIAIDLAEVAARAAQENVRINLPSLSADSERVAVATRTDAILAATEAHARELRARMSA